MPVFVIRYCNVRALIRKKYRQKLTRRRVPKRNGRQHASEIATMALDLLSLINTTVIPHLPGTNFKIRIGLHSGSVVAGVVGTQMPRYCVFGETVSIASKMESLGKENKIQVSQTTQGLLGSIGGFIMVERKDDEMRKDRDILNAFRGIVHTYWLLNKKGSITHRSDSSDTSSSYPGIYTIEKDKGHQPH